MNTNRRLELLNLLTVSPSLEVTSEFEGYPRVWLHRPNAVCVILESLWLESIVNLQHPVLSIASVGRCESVCCDWKMLEWGPTRPHYNNILLFLTNVISDHCPCFPCLGALPFCFGSRAGESYDFYVTPDSCVVDRRFRGRCHQTLPQSPFWASSMATIDKEYIWGEMGQGQQSLLHGEGENRKTWFKQTWYSKSTIKKRTRSHHIWESEGCVAEPST